MKIRTRGVNSSWNILPTSFSISIGSSFFAADSSSVELNNKRNASKEMPPRRKYTFSQVPEEGWALSINKGKIKYEATIPTPKKDSTKFMRLICSCESLVTRPMELYTDILMSAKLDPTHANNNSSAAK